MLFRKPTILAMAIVAATATASQAEIYFCKFNDPGRYNVIPRQVVVDVKTADTAYVVDPFLVHMKQSPKQASFVKNTTKLLRVRWTVDKMIFSDGGESDMKFSLVHRKDKNKAFVNLLITGADNTDQGTGQCELKK